MRTQHGDDVTVYAYVIKVRNKAEGAIGSVVVEGCVNVGALLAVVVEPNVVSLLKYITYYVELIVLGSSINSTVNLFSMYQNCDLPLQTWVPSVQ